MGLVRSALTGGAALTRSSPTPKRVRWDDRPCLHPHAAGLDSGASASGVALPPERDAEPVRVVEPFPPALHALVDGLLPCGIDTVALASTGVYAVPVFARLAPGGIPPSLVNARPVKTVPGRQSDGNEAQWLQKLHGLGLWPAPFRPDAARRSWRTLLRPRAAWIEPRAPHSLHRPQGLTLMPSQLREGLTARPGVTGHALVRASVRGEREPRTLAPWRHPACPSSADDRATARTGTWRAEQVRMLQQALACFDCYAHQRAARDARVEPQWAAMKPRFERGAPPRPLPRGTPGSTSPHRRGSRGRHGDLGVHGPDHPLRGRHRHAPLPHRDALRLVARAGAAPRRLRRSSVARAHAESGQSCHPSLSTSGTGSGPVGLRCRRLLPRPAGPARAAAGHGGHRAEARPRRLAPAAVSRAVHR